MKQICSLALFLIFFTMIGCSQTNISSSKLTGNIENDLRILLPTGKVHADIMDGVSQTPRQLELTKKFQTSIKQNYEWFVDYMKSIPKGQQMPYHVNLGLTKREYDELQVLMDNIEVVSTGVEDISIQIKNDIVHFKSQHKLSALDSLTIDLKRNIVSFGQLKMLIADTLNVTSEKNGLKSKWTGYSWAFEEPQNLDVNQLKDVSSLKIKQYKLTIGRLAKNGKTYMSLKGREIDGGAKIVDFELPILF